MVREIVLFTTGGTIASADQGGGARPVLAGHELLEGTGPLPDDVRVRVEPVFQVPSGHLSVDDALGLCRRAEEVLAGPQTVGAVVTHGTDTLEETAFLAYMTVASPKPLVFTGSMRTATQTGYDGKRNLWDALRVALAPEARGLGPLVVLDEEIHSARWVTKAHTQRLGTFESTGGPLGVVHEAGPVIDRRPAWERHVVGPAAAGPVDVVVMTLGCGADQLVASLERGVRGVVIAGYGGGRVHPDCLDPIARAVAGGVPVVIAPRGGAAGYMDDPYDYPGAHTSLRERGCIFAHDLTPAKARLKLMVALGNEMAPEAVRAWFEQEAQTRAGFP